MLREPQGSTSALQPLFSNFPGRLAYFSFLLLWSLFVCLFVLFSFVFWGGGSFLCFLFSVGFVWFGFFVVCFGFLCGGAVRDQPALAGEAGQLPATRPPRSRLRRAAGSSPRRLRGCSAGRAPSSQSQRGAQRRGSAEGSAEGPGGRGAAASGRRRAVRGRGK